MKYKVMYRVPTIDEYLYIRNLAGLSPRDRSSAQLGLKNTLFAICIEEVTEPNTAIGMGRIIGDGGTSVQITDIAVIPRCQKMGVGAIIMEELVTFVRKNLHPLVFVSLIADRDARGFYKKFGFVERGLEEPAMVLKHSR